MNKGHFKTHTVTTLYKTVRESPISGLSDKHFINLDGLPIRQVSLLRRRVRSAVGNEVNLQYVNIHSELCHDEEGYVELARTFEQNLAAHLAVGHRCFVYGMSFDESNQPQIPRAISHGVPFIRFLLMRAWKGSPQLPITSPEDATIFGVNHALEWSMAQFKLNAGFKRRAKHLRYIAKEMGVATPKLHGVYLQGLQDTPAAVRNADGLNEATAGLLDHNGDQVTELMLAENGLRVVHCSVDKGDIEKGTELLKPLPELWGTPS